MDVNRCFGLTTLMKLPDFYASNTKRQVTPFQYISFSHSFPPLVGFG